MATKWVQSFLLGEQCLELKYGYSLQNNGVDGLNATELYTSKWSIKRTMAISSKIHKSVEEKVENYILNANCVIFLDFIILIAQLNV